MVGKVDFDETRLATITAWIPGRLDRLFVDYTGVPVRKGDHLVSLYSPSLLTAQEELLQALKAVENLNNSNITILRDSTLATLKAAREKLRLWGLTETQIKEIEQRGTPSEHMTIFAPTSGIVIHKAALEGMYVKEGTRIYTIADLSQVWVKLDAYESDLQWLRYGQTVEFTTVAYPGEVFTGTIAFINPVLDSRTRSVKMRVNVPNQDGRLKPDMFVKAVVKTQVAGAGHVMDQALAGQWICPMHPDVIKPEPGDCDICEMPLVTTESLGYVSDDPATTEMPLVIPASATLITGTRAVVYVKVPDANSPTFEGREIELGPRAGNYYLVKNGLSEGELVVIRGNFKIDAELQIQAKSSMMTPEGSNATMDHDHGMHAMSPDAKGLGDIARPQVDKVMQGYFTLQQALAADNAHDAMTVAKDIQSSLKAVDMESFDEASHAAWMKSAGPLQKVLDKIAKTHDITAQREAFGQISQLAKVLINTFGTLGANTIYIMHCPMAFDNAGADWLQDSNDLRNPYFGEMMLKCGSIEEVVTQK
jgi:Cu(I)/Ag(I) efflux system membrane fusion protein